MEPVCPVLFLPNHSCNKPYPLHVSAFFLLRLWRVRFVKNKIPGDVQSVFRLASKPRALRTPERENCIFFPPSTVPFCFIRQKRRVS